MADLDVEVKLQKTEASLSLNAGAQSLSTAIDFDFALLAIYISFSGAYSENLGITAELSSGDVLIFNEKLKGSTDAAWYPDSAEQFFKRGDEVRVNLDQEAGVTADVTILTSNQ